MMSSVTICWAALGVALTSATQLRMAALPVGPGEALLALWMVFVAFCLLRKVPFSFSAAFKPFAFYWSIAAVLLAAGSIVAIVFHKLDGPDARHDALAFAFIGPLICMLAIRVGDVSNEQYYLSLARATLFTVSAMGLFLLAASLVTSQLGPVRLWYGGGARFRGWAENPNQLAMFMHPMPFLGWYLLQRAQRLAHKSLCLVAISVCMVVGLATDSDALKVSWAGAAGVIATWHWCELLVRGRGNFLHVGIAYFLVPVVVVTLAIGLANEIVSGIEGLVEEVYNKGDRGQIGMILLRHGLEAIGQSPLVGWGPGAYSGDFGPFESREAHNTVVDWGMSTGGLGMLLYLGLLFWCTLRAIRSGSPWLLGALVATVGDSLFGYSLRQPMFWLMLVLVVTLPGPMARRTASVAPLPQQDTVSARGPPVYAPAMQRSRREPSASARRMQ